MNRKLRKRLGAGFMALCMAFMVPLSVSAETVAEIQAEQDRLEQEKLDFFERVRHGYLTEARQAPQRCAVMDGARRPEDVFQSIKEILEPLLCTLR